MAFEYAFFLSITFLAALLGVASLFDRAQVARYKVKGFFMLLIVTLVVGLNLVIVSVSGTPYTVESVDLLNKQKGSIILYYVLVEDIAIFYWLMPDGEREPFYLKRAWTDEEADRLTEKFEQARREGGHLRYEPSLNDVPTIDIIPFPQAQEKPSQDAPNAPSEQERHFEHPGFDA